MVCLYIHLTKYLDRLSISVLAEYSGYTDKNPPCGVWCVRFSPDGRHLVVGSKFKTYVSDFRFRAALSYKIH